MDFFLTHILVCVCEREDTTSFECDRMRRVFIRVLLLLFVKDKMGLRFVVSDEGTIYKCIRGKVLLTVIFECLICQAIAITVRTRVRTAIRQVCFQIQIAMCIVTSVWYRVLHYILYKGEEVLEFSYTSFTERD